MATAFNGNNYQVNGQYISESELQVYEKELKTFKTMCGTAPDSLIMELGPDETLVQVYQEQQRILDGMNLTISHVTSYFGGIYDRQYTMYLLNKEGPIDGIYTITKGDEYQLVIRCPFCKKTNCTSIMHKPSHNILHYTMFHIKNEKNYKSVNITKMEIHMMMEHSYIPSRIFMELLDMMDIEKILNYKPSYISEYMMVFKQGSSGWTGKQYDTLYHKLLEEISFEKIKFENGMVGYVFPKSFDSGALYEELKKIPEIKTKMKIASETIRQTQGYRNSNNMNIICETDKSIDSMVLQVASKITWQKICEDENTNKISALQINLKCSGAKKTKMSEEQSSYLDNLIEEVCNREKFLQNVKNDYMKLKGLVNGSFNDLCILLTNPTQSEYYETPTRTMCISDRISFLNSSNKREAWYSYEMTKYMQLFE